MKPLIDLPSGGTLRAGPQWVIVFLIVALFGPIVIVSLLVLSPVLPALAGIYRKKPAWVWRTALAACLTASIFLIAKSPLYGDGYASIEISDDPHGYKTALATPIILAIIAEIPLLPLIVASVIHSEWLRRREAGSRSESSGGSESGGRASGTGESGP